MDETTGVFEQDSPESSVYLLFGEINTDSVVNACAWILQANFEKKKKPSHLTLLINSHKSQILWIKVFISSCRITRQMI